MKKFGRGKEWGGGGRMGGGQAKRAAVGEQRRRSSSGNRWQACEAVGSAAGTWVRKQQPMQAKNKM